MTKQAMNVYEWLKGHDVLEWLRPLWENSAWIMDNNGKLVQNKTTYPIDSPWVYHGDTSQYKCFLWSRIMFHTVSVRMPQLFADGKPFVPIGCQNCYKVVVKPRTVVELFGLDELQGSLDRPCKCGIEVRESVHGLYGGYFYNTGLKAGKQCYEKIRSKVKTDIPVILKRGCTEMEHTVGPSDQWKITDEQIAIEKLIEETVICPPERSVQPESVVHHVKLRWINFAYQNGDSSYLELSNGKPIAPDYVTYHHDVSANRITGKTGDSKT